MRGRGCQQLGRHCQGQHGVWRQVQPVLCCSSFQGPRLRPIVLCNTISLISCRALYSLQLYYRLYIAASTMSFCGHEGSLQCRCLQAHHPAVALQ